MPTLPMKTSARKFLGSRDRVEDHRGPLSGPGRSPYLTPVSSQQLDAPGHPMRELHHSPGQLGSRKVLEYGAEQVEDRRSAADASPRAGQHLPLGKLRPRHRRRPRRGRRAMDSSVRRRVPVGDLDGDRPSAHAHRPRRLDGPRTRAGTRRAARGAKPAATDAHSRPDIRCAGSRTRTGSGHRPLRLARTAAPGPRQKARRTSGSNAPGSSQPHARRAAGTCRVLRSLRERRARREPRRRAMRIDRSVPERHDRRSPSAARPCVASARCCRRVGGRARLRPMGNRDRVDKSAGRGMPRARRLRAGIPTAQAYRRSRAG